MSQSEIERDFPALGQGDYQINSAQDFNYNCLAFALGDSSQWWEPPRGFGGYWPDGFSQDLSITTVISILGLHGFKFELPSSQVPVGEAIAIYAIGDEWTHFAKFSNGQWASKLGDGHDIVHHALDSLEGSLYGKVVKILTRSDGALKS
ncbi:MAG TPA: hypothetical protein VKU19_07700 [Bryobacteraceae bacterium]|nr:hypothetical protein [Bryobacteraceae bacterium]